MRMDKTFAYELLLVTSECVAEVANIPEIQRREEAK